jgi:hypothetical protein
MQKASTESAKHNSSLSWAADDFHDLFVTSRPTLQPFLFQYMNLLSEDGAYTWRSLELEGKTYIFIFHRKRNLITLKQT